MTEKQGLHGVKAFFVVVSSGLIAGFLVVAIVTSFARTILFAVEEGAASAEQGQVLVQQTGEAHESIPPEGLDICELTIQTVSGVSLRPSGESDSPPEESTEDGVWSSSDSCSWELVPEYGVSVPWNFYLNYKMVLGSPEGESGVEISRADFLEFLESSPSLLGEVISEGQGEGVDESYYFYGAADDDPRVTRYVFVGRVKSTSYQIIFDDINSGSSGERVPLSAFQNEAEKINSRMAIDLAVWVPD
ncbi:hypothetical protein NI17_023125 [Thermobifida halotolerans]|uniref:Uncharacterized protein n=1 Tax=Thermobifida halotolerans TaxID=483545 RepID=A0AA97LWZ1_9ACTN|nr:hypothetical protein [Thermobifida halotolerans]UOE19565.1 hypothetical protein NI17_023125 [Thermobifida halotolerans]